MTNTTCLQRGLYSTTIVWIPELFVTNSRRQCFRYCELTMKQLVKMHVLYRTITGGTMIGISQTAMNNAADVTRNAEAAVYKWRDEVNNYSNKVARYCDLVNGKENEISSTRSHLQEIYCTLQQLSQKRTATAEVQKKLRDATHFLSTLAGRVQVAEVQTRSFLFFDPLITILEDISQHIDQLSGNEKYQLLYQQDIKPMIDRLKENNPKLKAICNTGGGQFY